MILESKFFNKLIKDFGGYMALKLEFCIDNHTKLSSTHGMYKFSHQNALRKDIDFRGTFIVAKTLVELDKELTVIVGYEPFFKSNKHEKRIIREKLEWKH